MFETGDRVIRLRGNHEGVGSTGRIVEISERLKSIKLYDGSIRLIKCVRCRVLWDNKKLRTWVSDKDLCNE